VNLAGTAAIGVLGAAGRIPRDSDWRLVAEVVWALLPLSAAILLLTTLWQAASGYTRTAPRKALASLFLGAAGLAVWLVFRVRFGVLGG
jgi:hypothetical protein